MSQMMKAQQQMIGQRSAVSRQSLRVVAAKAAPAKAAKAGPPQGSTYVCLDCGYVYPGTLAAFEKLPQSYKCPVCKAPKKRFQLVEPGEEAFAIGPILIPGAATIAFLGAIYYYLHSIGKL